MEHVLITGGSGMIGTRLSRMLLEHGYKVSHLSHRNIRFPGIHTYYWNIPEGKADAEALRTADHIIHLAGAGIGERWTRKHKEAMVASRVKGAELLYSSLPADHSLKSFISASGSSYYGAVTSGLWFTEDYPPGNDFLARLCAQWEEASRPFRDAGVRTVNIRTGVVLANEGGALRKLRFPVKLFAGGIPGSGQQYLPWIHIDDICRVYIHALENNLMEGPYNAAAPAGNTFEEFMKALAGIMKRPVSMPHIPAVIMRLLFGEMSVTVLRGSRLNVKKLKDSGFNFLYDDLKLALLDLSGRPVAQ